LLALSYQLRVLRYPERYAKTGTLMVKDSLLPSAIKLENILDFKLNIESSGKTLALNALSKMQGQTAIPDAAGLKSSQLSGFSRGLKPQRIFLLAFLPPRRGYSALSELSRDQRSWIYTGIICLAHTGLHLVRVKRK
jgi:hypothetical protein